MRVSWSKDTGLRCGSVRLRSHLNHAGHLEAEWPYRYSEQERTRQGLVERREPENQKGEDRFFTFFREVYWNYCICPPVCLCVQVLPGWYLVNSSTFCNGSYFLVSFGKLRNRSLCMVSCLLLLDGHIKKCVHADINTHSHLNTPIHIHTHTHTHIQTETHSHTHTHMYTHMYTYTHTYMHTHVHIHVHTYTHTHSQ